MYKLLVAILAMLTLGAERLSAEGFTHSFDDMFTASPKRLTVTSGNQTGTADNGLVYTCSGNANAAFQYYSKVLCLGLKGSGAQVETTAIHNLDSLVISYWPSASKIAFDVQISADDGANWTDVTVVQPVAGQSTVQLRYQGDYKVRIKRKTTDVYFHQIEYVQNNCNCFRYYSE